MWQQRLRHDQRAQDVDLELPAHALDGSGFERPVGAVAGVVQQHIDATEALQSGGNRLSDRRLVLHVESRDQDSVQLLRVDFRIGAAHRGDHVPALAWKCFALALPMPLEDPVIRIVLFN